MHSPKHIIHHWFVPRDSNNYRARALHIHSLATYLIFFLALGFFVNHIQSTNNVLGYATDITKEKLFELTNEERYNNGLNKLTYNDKLAKAAEAKANDMFARNYWSHYGPDGTTPWSFILDAGYKYEYAGENLAKNFMFSDGVVQAWMNSKTHRENLLRKEYTEIGFAVADGLLNGEETTLVVQMFGTPLGSGPVANKPEVEEVQAAEKVMAVNDNETSNLAQKVSVQTQEDASSAKPSYTRMFFNGNILFIAFLIVAFVLDLFVAAKLNIIHLRLGGKTIAHVLFLVFILTGLLLVANGKII